MLYLIDDADFELRSINGEVSVEWQEYPMVRRAFDFRPAGGENCTRHARERAQNGLVKWMKLTPEMRCQ